MHIAPQLELLLVLALVEPIIAPPVPLVLVVPPVPLVLVVPPVPLEVNV
jgi:hypothetical protein